MRKYQKIVFSKVCCKNCGIESVKLPKKGDKIRVEMANGTECIGFVAYIEQYTVWVRSWNNTMPCKEGEEIDFTTIAFWQYLAPVEEK